MSYAPTAFAFPATDRPDIVRNALIRSRNEGLNSACAWTWYHASTDAERRAVDRFLVKIDHPLAHMAGSDYGRFVAFTGEMLDASGTAAF